MVQPLGGVDEPVRVRVHLREELVHDVDVTHVLC
jgi:Ni,Fe-hydrogenase III large subunit